MYEDDKILSFLVDEVMAFVDCSQQRDLSSLKKGEREPLNHCAVQRDECTLERSDRLHKHKALPP